MALVYADKTIFVKLDERNLDGLIVSSSANITYITRFNSLDSYLLISKKKNIYFTDSRYIAAARLNLKSSTQVKEVNGSVFSAVIDACRRLKLKRVGFEERNLPFAEYKKLKEEALKKIGLVATHGLIEGLRQVKTWEEVEKIREAVKITIAAFRFIKKLILPGKKEIEIAAELERFIRYAGGSGAAFDMIVASGANSSFPHHITGQRRIKRNEPVLVDIGINYQGYKTDLTRVFFSGKITPFFKKIYTIVLEAQEKAIRKIRPAIYINNIDRAARQHIKQKGYGHFFGHNLGHGIGLEIHEEPHISANNKNRLKAGMVFTVEPAIYLPNKFGVRIEDMVLVKRDGVSVLSSNLEK